MSEELTATAVIAALNALNAHAYDLDDDAIDTKQAPPAYYTEVTVSRRFGGVFRDGGETPDSTLYRATTRSVAKTLSNAREMRRRAAGLEGITVTVGGVVSSPIMFETEEIIGPDDGWFSGLTSWTFALVR